MSHVLITGGTGLIGATLVEGFLSKGFAVTFTTTSEEKGKSLCAEHNNSDLSFRVVTFRNEMDVSKFIEDNNNKGFTHLVNNARSLDGLFVGSNGFSNEQALKSEFFMAVTLSYLLSVGFLASLKNIINICSMYGVVPPNGVLYEDGLKSNPIQYGIAKAAQIHLTKELAIRFADNKIRVNAVSFGGIEGRVDDAFKERYARLCPSGRMLNINEIFPPVWFLADNASSGMTGHNQIVDGGWSVW